MDTCEQLKDRIENEILSNINSICFCFSRKCSYYLKYGMSCFHIFPPFNERRMEFLLKYESIRKLLSKQYHEVEIIIRSNSMDQIYFIQNFLKTCHIDGKVVTLRFKTNNEKDEFKDLLPFYGIQTFKSIEQITFDFETTFLYINHFIITSIEEVARFQLTSFGLYVKYFTIDVQTCFENFCNKKPECKIQLGFKRYPHMYLRFREILRPFDCSSNLTVLDLIKLNGKTDWNIRSAIKTNYECLEACVAYAPNVHTLKINIGLCSPNYWPEELNNLGLLTKLEIIWWYNEEAWSVYMFRKRYRDFGTPPLFTIMPNIEHLTLIITNETHSQIRTFVNAIRFPSLRTFTLKPIFRDWERCRQCYRCGIPIDKCFRAVYVEIIKYSPNLRSFFAFGYEWIHIFQHEEQLT